MLPAVTAGSWHEQANWQDTSLSPELCARLQRRGYLPGKPGYAWLPVEL